ncbi:hypothetical protein ACSBR2_000543 [Camellia fascicularis]
MGLTRSGYSLLLLILSAMFLLPLHVSSTSTERSTNIVHMDKSFMHKAFTAHHHCVVMSKDELETMKNALSVIDTGVWPKSESCKDDEMAEIPKRWKGTCDAGQEFNFSLSNLKLIGARYFNKGIVATNPNITLNMNSTSDTEGNGTHTSSTVAGNYANGAPFFGYAQEIAKGVAPRVRAAMYKVIWADMALL